MKIFDFFKHKKDCKESEIVNLTGVDKEIYDLFQTLNDREKQSYLKFLKSMHFLNIKDKFLK